MTLVTTSRRSTAVSRAVARDLAFALGGRYLARGKRGIRDLTDMDPSFFILAQEEHDLNLQYFRQGEQILNRKIIRAEHAVRGEVITRGVITSDPDLQRYLSGEYPAILSEEPDPVIRLDGPQRRRTILTLQKNPAGKR